MVENDKIKAILFTAYVVQKAFSIKQDNSINPAPFKYVGHILHFSRKGLHEIEI